MIGVQSVSIGSRDNVIPDTYNSFSGIVVCHRSLLACLSIFSVVITLRSLLLSSDSKQRRRRLHTMFYGVVRDVVSFTIFAWARNFVYSHFVGASF